MPTNPVSTDAEQTTGRRRVLDAAAELFVRQGYAATTLRQIAAAAGIKAGSIYHHFASKEELFVAVLHDGIAVMVQAFDATAAATLPAEPAQAQLTAHVRAHLGAVFEHGPYTTAHVTAFFNAPPDVRTTVVPARDGYERQWHQLFEQLFPGADSHSLRLHRLILFGAMNATVEWFDPSGKMSLDDLASTISDQFLNGVTHHGDANPDPDPDPEQSQAPTPQMSTTL